MTNGSASKQRTPEMLQQEISETRAELDDTLDEIGRRLSPQQIKERVVDSAKETMGEVGDTVQEHKMPLVFMGGIVVMGLWLHHRAQAREMQERAEQMRTLWDQTVSAIAAHMPDREARSTLANVASDVVSRVRDAAETAQSSVVDATRDVIPRISRTADELRESLPQAPSTPWIAVGLGIAALCLRSYARRI